MSDREVVERLQFQGVTEQITYRIDTTNYGGSPSSPITVVAYDERDWSVVTSTILSGSASVSGNYITLPLVLNGRINHTYRIVATYTVGADTRAPYVRVRFEL